MALATTSDGATGAAVAGDDFIGVFDSGVGGISVLRHLAAELPSERFHYFGDSANAPYGNRTPAEIAELAHGITSDFVGKGAKAVVIACNTATSVAAASLRDAYPEVPIVGVEPALKPAVAATPRGSVLVMATPVTLALDKFQRLAAELDGGATIIPVACEGLAARIERGKLDAPDLKALVESLVGNYRGAVDSVVLGCTHYPFVAGTIRSVLGNVALYDGGAGTARQLRRRLAACGLLATRDVGANGDSGGAPHGDPNARNPKTGVTATIGAAANGDIALGGGNVVSGAGNVGGVTFASSKDTPEELALYRWFYNLPMYGTATELGNARLPKHSDS